MNVLQHIFIFAVLLITSTSCTDGDKKSEDLSGAAEQEIIAKGGMQEDNGADISVLMGQGDNAFTARNFDEAIAQYKSAIVLNPDMAGLHYKLGLAYGHKMMLNEAIASFSSAISLDPNQVNAYNNLGLAYERKAMLTDAISQYEKAVSINPDYPQAHYNLARCYSLRKGQYPELYAEAASHCYKAGVLFLQRGDKQMALEAYNDLKQLDSKELEDALREKLRAASQSGTGGSTFP